MQPYHFSKYVVRLALSGVQGVSRVLCFGTLLGAVSSKGSSDSSDRLVSRLSFRGLVGICVVVAGLSTLYVTLGRRVVSNRWRIFSVIWRVALGTFGIGAVGLGLFLFFSSVFLFFSSVSVAGYLAIGYFRQWLLPPVAADDVCTLLTVGLCLLAVASYDEYLQRCRQRSAADKQLLGMWDGRCL